MFPVPFLHSVMQLDRSSTELSVADRFKARQLTDEDQTMLTQEDRQTSDEIDGLLHLVEDNQRRYSLRRSELARQVEMLVESHNDRQTDSPSNASLPTEGSEKVIRSASRQARAQEQRQLKRMQSFGSVRI